MRVTLSSTGSFGRVAMILAAATVAGLLLGQGCTSAVAAPAVNSRAPDFTLTDLDGNQVRLRDFRGQVVFLNFWATWCPPCRAEMPEIEAVYQQYRDQGVVVIGIDLRESPEVVRRFVEEGGYSWTFVIDTTGEVGLAYRINAIPASYFIDADGIIRAVHAGAMTRGGMESRLKIAMNP